MYIFFDKLNAVLTCEIFPRVLLVDEMKADKLEYLCDKWEKKDTENNKFTLSYKYEKKTCLCDNTAYENISDFELYDCYNCGRLKKEIFENGIDLYLQNSGSQDIVWSDPNNKFCEMCTVNNLKNAYQWFNEDYRGVFALHIENNMLSDMDISKEIQQNENLDNTHIIFVEDL